MLSLEVVEEAPSNRLLNLLRVIAPLSFVVVEAHLGDLLSRSPNLEVLQSLWNQLSGIDVKDLACKLGIFVQGAILRVE